MTDPDKLVIGTRGSPLALVQAHMVADALRAGQTGRVEIMTIRTTGDAILDRPLAEIGGKGLFTREIDDALLDGRADLAVHSMKDLPTRLPDGIVVAAVLERADPRDVLLDHGAPRIADLARGALVGTASLRRKAQLLALRPDLRVVPLRGNVETRLGKVRAGTVEATLLAAAGLNRLGVQGHGGATLEVDEMLPAVAQGAIAVACRAGDTKVATLLARLDHRATALCVTAERALLAVLDGSCRTPIAAYARLSSEELLLDGLVAAPDGSALVRGSRRGPAGACAELGLELGLELKSQAQPSWLDRQ